MSRYDIPDDAPPPYTPQSQIERTAAGAVYRHNIPISGEKYQVVQLVKLLINNSGFAFSAQAFECMVPERDLSQVAPTKAIDIVDAFLNLRNRYVNYTIDEGLSFTACQGDMYHCDYSLVKNDPEVIGERSVHPLIITIDCVQQSDISVVQKALLLCQCLQMMLQRDMRIFDQQLKNALLIDEFVMPSLEGEDLTLKPNIVSVLSGEARLSDSLEQDPPRLSLLEAVAPFDHAQFKPNAGEVPLKVKSVGSMSLVDKKNNVWNASIFGMDGAEYILKSNGSGFGKSGHVATVDHKIVTKGDDRVLDVIRPRRV